MKPPREANGRNCRGFTLLELLISTSLMTVLMVMIVHSIGGLTETRSAHKRHAYLGDVADRVARSIERDAGYAARVFVQGTDANDYLGALAFPTADLATGSRLPVLTGQGYFDRDAPSTPETGNMLFLGASGTDIGVVVSVGEGVTETRVVGSLRFIVYYLTPNIDGGLDLARWESVPVVNYWDIQQIDDASIRTATLTELYAVGVRHAWDVTAPRFGGLHEVVAAGAMQPLDPAKKVPASATQSINGIYFARHIEIARSASIKGIELPLFADIGGSPVFPGGFEIKVDGTSAGKLVLLRMVVRSSLPNRREIFTEIRRLVNCGRA